ncbi:MAG: ATP-dependent DNA helicase [Bacteroidota bacterium]
MTDKHSIKTFETAYNQLNNLQQTAVIETEGPVLVIAGPGTGKTQILAARIAHILATTDTIPENILCLTYTDAGTIAMRKRLQQFIGADAYRVQVFTFHSFCNMVIQENLDYFGLKGLDAISELEQIAYVHEIIDSFGTDHPLKRYTGDVYYETEKLLSLYESMKKENWSAAFLSKKADDYIADLPTRDAYIYKRATKTAKAGDIKQAAVDVEVKKMNELKAAAQTFAIYQQKLARNSRYDFADMIVWVINAFKDKPELLSIYQERFLYFLVDEYQDTSGSQNELLELLISYWDKPNVFCVGDDDQSIYRFQGANIENIEQFIKKYAPLTITLEDNYRSSQFILDASRALIGSNVNRINPDKQLVAHNILSYEAPQPEIRSYYNTTHEIVCIAQEIIALQRSGVALNEIAVLYRKHSQADELIKYLKSKNITVNARKKINALDEPFIRQIIRILTYIDAEYKKAHTGEAFVYELLHYDFFHNDPIEIARISVEVYKQNFSERNTSWREELRRAHLRKGPDLFSSKQPGEQLFKTSQLLEKWIKERANSTVQQLIESVISESGMLVMALSGLDKIWNMQLLHTFFDLVKTECSRNPRTDLTRLLNTLMLMQNEGVDLPTQRISYAEDGVHFLTVHSSKGLEFQYVYMIGCTTKAWEKGAGNRDFKLPDTLFTIISEDESEENRRLFYVAMTRAKTHLYISFAERDTNGKELEKSRFVAELETQALMPVATLHASDEALLEFESSLFQAKPVKTLNDIFDNDFVDELLAKYTLSVTHLNNYLKCPTAFYFTNIIRVPAPLSASMTFGSAVHHALEMLFKNMNAHEGKQFGTADDLYNDFKWYMRKHEDSFTEMEYKRRLEYGQEILPKYYNRYINEWNKITSVERSYRNIVMDEVPMNGKLDKLEFDGNVVNVVDYKTGQPDNAKKKFDRPDAEKVSIAKEAGKDILFEDEYGGDYWRQAVFYKILMDFDQTKNWEMRTAEFDFIEPDRKSGGFVKHKVAITPEDITVVKQQIIKAYHAIKTKQFSKGCQKDDCVWCGFVNDYYSGDKSQNVMLKATEDQD